MFNRLSRSLPARNSRFRRFLTATTVSLIGSNVFDIAMPLYVLHRSGSVIDLSLVSAALHLPHFLMAPITGYFSDHGKKRMSLVLADLGQVAFLLMLSAYVASGAESLWPVFALVFLIKSLMLTFETISSFQMIPGLVGPAELTGANTWFLSLHRVIQIVGPLTGGVLIYYFGIQSCIWTNILSFAATLHFTWSFKNLDRVLSSEKSEHAIFPSPRVVIRQFRESLDFIWRSPIFHPFILLMFLWNLSPLTLNSPSLTYYFTVSQGFTPAKYGFFVSLFGILGILGFLLSHVLYRDKAFAPVFHRSALFQAFFGTLCVLPLGMPILVAFLYGVSRSGGSILSMGSYYIRQTKVPRAQNGAINASLRMFFMAAAPLSSIMQGWIIAQLGVTAALLFGALCLWGVWYYSMKLARAYEEEQNLLSPYPILPERKRA